MGLDFVTVAALAGLLCGIMIPYGAIRAIT